MCCPGVNGCPRGGCVTPRQFSDGTCFGHTGIRYQVNDTFPAGDQCNNWYVNALSKLFGTLLYLILVIINVRSAD